MDRIISIKDAMNKGIVTKKLVEDFNNYLSDSVLNNEFYKYYNSVDSTILHQFVCVLLYKYDNEKNITDGKILELKKKYIHSMNCRIMERDLRNYLIMSQIVSYTYLIHKEYVRLLDLEEVSDIWSGINKIYADIVMGYYDLFYLSNEIIDYQIEIHMKDFNYLVMADDIKTVLDKCIKTFLPKNEFYRYLENTFTNYVRSPEYKNSPIGNLFDFRYESLDEKWCYSVYKDIYTYLSVTGKLDVIYSQYMIGIYQCVVYIHCYDKESNPYFKTSNIKRLFPIPNEESYDFLNMYHEPSISKNIDFVKLVSVNELTSDSEYFNHISKAINSLINEGSNEVIYVRNVLLEYFHIELFNLGESDIIKEFLVRNIFYVLCQDSARNDIKLTGEKSNNLVSKIIFNKESSDYLEELKNKIVKLLGKVNYELIIKIASVTINSFTEDDVDFFGNKLKDWKGEGKHPILKLKDSRLIAEGKFYDNIKVKYNNNNQLNSLVGITLFFNIIDELEIGPKHKNCGLIEELGSKVPVISEKESFEIFIRLFRDIDYSLDFSEKMCILDDSGVILDYENNNVEASYYSIRYKRFLKIFSFEIPTKDIAELLGWIKWMQNATNEDILKKFSVKVEKDSYCQLASNIYCMITNYGRVKHYNLDKEKTPKDYCFPNMEEFKLFRKLNVDREDFIDICESCFSENDDNKLDFYLLFELFYGIDGIINILQKYFITCCKTIISDILYRNNIVTKYAYEKELDGGDKVVRIRCCKFSKSENCDKIISLLDKGENKKFEIRNRSRFNDSVILLTEDDDKKLFKYIIILAKLGTIDSPHVKLNDELKQSEDFMSSLNDISYQINSRDIIYEDYDFIKFILSNISFKFESVFKELKVCKGNSVSDLDLENFSGTYIEQLGNSLTIYSFKLKLDNLDIDNQFYIDFFEDFNFSFEDGVFKENELYSVMTDDLIRVGGIGKSIAEKKLEHISKELFIYIFYSIIILDKQYIQWLAENVKNRKVVVDESSLIEGENVSDKDDKLEEKLRHNTIGGDSKKEKVTIRKNSLTPEELELINSINSELFDNDLDIKEMNGIKIMSLNSLFISNIERVFKGNRILERVKPKYKLKSWNVRGYTRTYESGKQVYIPPRTARRNTELLDKDAIEKQQKIITDNNLFDNTELF